MDVNVTACGVGPTVVDSVCMAGLLILAWLLWVTESLRFAWSPCMAELPNVVCSLSF
jgi:hypothetical protein